MWKAFKNLFSQEYKPVKVLIKCPNCKSYENISPFSEGLEHKGVHVCKCCGVLFSPKVILRNMEEARNGH